MSIEKTSAIILSVMPYRETSLIVTLFTDKYGKISGIAKGIKKSKAQLTPVERGQIIDVVVYLKPSRDLHVLADIQVTKFFPSIRSDLEKTALRDIAIELLLKSIKDTESHPELFCKTQQVYSDIDTTGALSCNFVYLWRYILDVAKYLGFELNLQNCQSCNSNVITSSKNGAYFMIEKGGILCGDCCKSKATNTYFFPLNLLQNLCTYNKPLTVNFTKSDLLKITKLLIYFCRLHMEIHRDFKSVEFIEEIL